RQPSPGTSTKPRRPSEGFCETEMSDDRLNALKQIRAPAPTESARRRAIQAAMLAYDQAQQNSIQAPKGDAGTGRLRTIFDALKGNWIMDTRVSIGLGTAAIALLLLPLGYQLYTTTAITPLSFESGDSVDPVAPDAEEPKSVALSEAEKPATQPAGNPADEQGLVAEPIDDGRARVNGRGVTLLEMDATGDAAAQPGAETATKRQEFAGADQPAAGTVAPLVGSESLAAMPAPEPMMMPQTMPSGDEFTDFDESPVKVVAEEPVSTFSIDVDTASYSYVRRLLG